MGLWAIAVLLPKLAVAVRRLSDAGYGWGHLFWLLVPIAGIVVFIVFVAQPSKAATPAPTAPTGNGAQRRDVTSRRRAARQRFDRVTGRVENRGSA